ncbi:MAG: ATP-binding protein [bacterium]
MDFQLYGLIIFGLLLIAASSAASVFLFAKNGKKIIKQGKLPNSRYAIYKSITYFILIFFTALIFAGILIFKQNGLALVSPKYEIKAIIIIIFIAFVVIKFLEIYLSKITEAMFLGELSRQQTYDYQKTLDEGSRAIASTLEHGKILSLITDLLKKTIGINNVSLLKYNKEEYIFSEISKNKNRWILNINHPIIRILKKVQAPISIEDIANWQKDSSIKKNLNLIDATSSLQIIKNDLQSRNFAFIFPLIAKQQLVGILAIGEKFSKTKYTADEIKLLSTLTHQIATAIENANLYHYVRKTELAIRDERDKIQSIITNLADGLIVIDKNKKIILINPVAERLFPAERLSQEPLPKILDQDIGEKKMAEIKFPLISEAAINGKIIRIICAPLFDQKEGHTGYIKILHDITRDKEIDKIKSDFIRTAAHKLRTPLSAVKWILQMLIDGDLGETPQSQKEFLEKGYQSNERMIRVVNDLLNVSEIEEGKFGFHFEKTQIIDIIKDVIKKLESLAKEKKQKLNFDYNEKTYQINGDPYKLRMAITVLILNSIQYTPYEGKINIKLENLERDIKFTITDNGFGIPSSQQNKLFTKFMRGDNIIEKETEGSGLGLFIAKNIINGHGGKIGFESSENKGSTFYFTIPMTR